MLNEPITIQLVGYQIRSADSQPIGQIEGIRDGGIRLHRLPGYPAAHGFLPTQAIDRIDRTTNTVHLIPGITIDTVVDAPPPPGEDPQGWRKSADWWANLLGHYGLFESEGRGSEPILHPDQR